MLMEDSDFLDSPSHPRLFSDAKKNAVDVVRELCAIRVTPTPGE
jgi:hypothetical protein